MPLSHHQFLEHCLVQRQVGRKLFAAFGQILEGKGFTAREDSIVDASFGEAPHQRNSQEQNRRIKEGQRPEELDTNPAVGRKKDSQARCTKKKHEVPYGWKNHVKADLKTKLILSYSNTSANIHDSQVFEELLDGERPSRAGRQRLSQRRA